MSKIEFPGHHRFTIGPFQIDWYTGGGWVESHLLWRYQGVPVVIVLGGMA